MAIYHLTAKVVSRDKGQSVVASAAYRAAAGLYDERLGQTWDYTRKQGVRHTEILAPKGAPAWIYDRERLWNVVEAGEKRKDSQLAREIEIALPRELDAESQISLLRDFVQREFVSKGMVADASLHRDNLENPHAHVLLTLRRIGASGFGLKERSWNARSNLLQWRIGWAEVANEHLARAGLAIRIDHRTLEAQEIDLIPGRKIGVSKDRQQDPALPRRIAERVEEQRRIASLNGENILADPSIAFRALTHQRATFTKRDIARFLNTRTDGADQFQAALLKATTSPELVELGHDDHGQKRFTTREMLEIEEGMLHRTQLMTLRRGHATSTFFNRASLIDSLNSEQVTALDELTTDGDLKVLVGVAGSGKSRLLSKTRQAWEAAGFTVKGAALAGIAAESLSDSSGIEARTLASYEYAWKNGRDPLTSNDIFVIDEAGMVGTRQLARVLEAAEAAGAKVVLVGDPYEWQRDTTVQLAKGATADGLAAYAQHEADAFDDGHDLTKPVPPKRSFSMDAIEAIQQRAAERWQAKQRARELGLTEDEATRSADPNEELDSPTNDPLPRDNLNAPDLSRSGPEDELDL